MEVRNSRRKTELWDRRVRATGGVRVGDLRAVQQAEIIKEMQRMGDKGALVSIGGRCCVETEGMLMTE